MKERPYGFLAPEHIAHDSEVFDYIKELHAYLWDFIHVAFPHKSGDLQNYVDDALRELRRRAGGRSPMKLFQSCIIRWYQWPIVWLARLCGRDVSTGPIRAVQFRGKVYVYGERRS